MADVVLNIFLVSFLIIIQSFFLNELGFYDVTLVWIVFFFTNEKNKLKVLFLCLAAGYIKDSLSGGVFGVYLSSYLWFFMLLYITAGFLNIRNYIFILFLGICGIGIESVFIFISNYSRFIQPESLSYIYNGFIYEILWGILTFLVFYFVMIRTDMVYKNMLSGFKKKISDLSRI
jgi:cell shape-determining protein MreD